MLQCCGDALVLLSDASSSMFCDPKFSSNYKGTQKVYGTFSVDSKTAYWRGNLVRKTVVYEETSRKHQFS